MLPPLLASLLSDFCIWIGLSVRKLPSPFYSCLTDGGRPNRRGNHCADFQSARPFPIPAGPGGRWGVVQANYSKRAAGQVPRLRFCHLFCYGSPRAPCSCAVLRSPPRLLPRTVWPGATGASVADFIRILTGQVALSWLLRGALMPPLKC